MVGKEHLVCTLSMVESKQSAKFCLGGMGYMCSRISVVNQDLVCIVDIIWERAGVLVHGMEQVGVGGSI